MGEKENKIIIQGKSGKFTITKKKNLKKQVLDIKKGIMKCMNQN